MSQQKNHKLGIIIPYRDRANQLFEFKKEIGKHIDFDYEVIVVEQLGDQDFNRGKLLNIGFVKAEELGCDYVVFHDVDMIPVDVDYSYVDKPIHLITDLDLPDGVSRTLFDEYFGGVTLFPSNIFKQINGYSNEYWGWGFEDDDLLLRCQENHVKLDEKKVLQKGREGVALEFNGKDSFVKCPNIINSYRNFTIFCSFTVGNLTIEEYEITDEMSVFSIPGFDTALNYNSFRDFVFQFWKKDLSSISIPSDKFPEGTYNVAITIDNMGSYSKDEHGKYVPDIKMYINGEYVNHNFFDKLLPLQEQDFLYLGVGNPERDAKQNWFNGCISTFAVYNEVLDDKLCKQITSNINSSLFKFKDSEFLRLYYDMKFTDENKVIDLSGNGNDGYSSNTNQVDTQYTTETSIPIPSRKEGKFKVLPHSENGYKDGYWVSWNSRKNQINYYTKFYNDRSKYTEDGISSLPNNYTIRDQFTSNNFHHLEVQI